jgi:hypothetical protein
MPRTDTTTDLLSVQSLLASADAYIDGCLCKARYEPVEELESAGVAVECVAIKIDSLAAKVTRLNNQIESRLRRPVN